MPTIVKKNYYKIYNLFDYLILLNIKNKLIKN